VIDWLSENGVGMVLFALVSVLGVALFRSGRRHRGGAGRVVWFVGAFLCAAFLVLATLSMRFEPLARGAFRLEQFIVRILVVVIGVVLVVMALVRFAPQALDVLERRSFVSFVSARHIRASKSGFLTVISFLSILAVSISSCALCTVTSVMGGFGHDLKGKILGNTAHVVVDVSQPGGFSGWRPTLAKLRQTVEAQGGVATPIAGGEAMASSISNTAGAIIRGIDPETVGGVIAFDRNIEVGRFDYLTYPEKLLELPADEVIGRGPGGEPFVRGPRYPDLNSFDLERPPAQVLPGIILGQEIAKSLHVLVGDELTLLSPLGELGPTGIMPRAKKFRVAAIFYSGMYEYDASHAYVLRDVAQDFFSLGDRITAVDVAIPDPEKVDLVRPRIDVVVDELNKERSARQAQLGATKNVGRDRVQLLRVRDWKEMNKSLFSALKLEKVATFIILCIAIAVASFCILCTLLLMVTEKTKEIAVLKSLGTSARSIMRVFIFEGVLIGAAGTVLGVSVALGFCTGLSWTGVRLDPDVYYIDKLPVNVDLGDYAMVAIAAMVICTLSTILPAVAGSQVRPVDGLRYE